MNAIVKLASASLLVIAAAACNDNLIVQNLSNPDVKKVFDDKYVSDAEKRGVGK